MHKLRRLVRALVSMPSHDVAQQDKTQPLGGSHVAGGCELEGETEREGELCVP